MQPPAAQQGPPAVPHFTHARSKVVGLVKQLVPASVQATPVPQHAWFSLPHSQMLAVQVPAYPVVMTQAAPGATQRFDEQHAPAELHLLPAQHGLPVTPQGRHVAGAIEVSQTLVVSLQRFPAQHGSPGPPHFRHCWEAVAVEVQMVPDSLQNAAVVVLAGQQGWPALPHAHEPALHIPYVRVPFWQVWPLPTHRPARQHPPPPQVEPSQHTSPGPPHTTQVVPWQVVPEPQRGALLQQGSPGPPQLMQVPGTVVDVDEHLAPAALQVLPQQGCPLAPQPEQTPPVHMPLVVPHALPGLTQMFA